MNRFAEMKCVPPQSLITGNNDHLGVESRKPYQILGK